MEFVFGKHPVPSEDCDGEVLWETLLQTNAEISVEFLDDNVTFNGYVLLEDEIVDDDNSNMFALLENKIRDALLDLLSC